MHRVCSLVNLTIFLFISFAGSSTVVAQSTNYSIRYACFMSMKQPLTGDDSIKIIRNGIVTKAPLTLPDSISVEQSFLTCAVEGNKDSAVLKHITGRSVLTMFYQNGAWWFHDEGKVTELPLQTATYQTTTEKKLILGYESTKVIMTTAYDVIDVWIATGLPSSLMPIAGFRPMDGAILELTSIKTYIKFVAQEVIAQN